MSMCGCCQSCPRTNPRRHIHWFAVSRTSAAKGYLHLRWHFSAPSHQIEAFFLSLDSAARVLDARVPRIPCSHMLAIPSWTAITRLVTGTCIAPRSCYLEFQPWNTQTASMVGPLAMCSNWCCKDGAASGHTKYSIVLYNAAPAQSTLKVSYHWSGCSASPELSIVARLHQANRRARSSQAYMYQSSSEHSYLQNRCIYSYLPPSAVSHTPARRLSPAPTGAHRSPIHTLRDADSARTATSTTG